MAKRDVKGLHPVVSKGHRYWYAWRGRGAPRVHGEYGTPEFWASYDAAVRERHIPEPGRFRSLVTLYKASADYQKLAPSTKLAWGPWLDRTADYFDLSIAAFDNPKVRKIIRQWRNRYAATPRTADMGMQVLSRVCAYAVDRSASSPLILARASRRSTPTTAQKSFGLMSTLPASNSSARRKLRAPSIWRRRPACGSATCCALRSDARSCWS